MAHRILILNGPNLNLLGKRETEVYGAKTFESYFQQLCAECGPLALDHRQTNVEGELVNLLQQAAGHCDGIVLNAGGYTHTSVAIRDAVAAIDVPVVEVHISNVMAREEFRHTSLLTGVCVGIISGFGLHGYRLAVDALRMRLEATH